MPNSPPIPFFVLRAHKGSVGALRFISHIENLSLCKGAGPALLSGSSDGDIFYWSFENYRVKYTLNGHDGNSILWLGVHKNNILSQGREGCIKVWHLKEGNWIVVRTISSAELNFCPASIFEHLSYYYMAIPTKVNTVLDVVNCDSYNTVSSITLPSHGMCMDIKTIKNKETIYLFCAYEDGFILVWNYDLKMVVSEVQFLKETMICLDVDFDKKRGVSGFPEGPLLIWNIGENMNLEIHESISLNNTGVNVVAIRPDKKIMVAGCSDGSIHVFSWKTLKPLAILEGQHSILSLQFSPDDIFKHKSVFASGSKETNISLWSIY